MIKWSTINVRGNCYFDMIELKTQWAIIGQLQAGDVFEVHLINLYMGDKDFIREGEQVAGEKVEMILDRAERAGDMDIETGKLQEGVGTMIIRNQVFFHGSEVIANWQTLLRFIDGMGAERQWNIPRVNKYIGYELFRKGCWIDQGAFEVLLDEMEKRGELYADSIV